MEKKVISITGLEKRPSNQELKNKLINVLGENYDSLSATDQNEGSNLNLPIGPCMTTIELLKLVESIEKIIISEYGNLKLNINIEVTDANP